MIPLLNEHFLGDFLVPRQCSNPGSVFCVQSELAVVKLLLNQDDVNTDGTGDLPGWAALIVRLLLERASNDLVLIDDALSIAAFKEFEEVARLLLK
jgi:hypothetical protein